MSESREQIFRDLMEAEKKKSRLLQVANGVYIAFTSALVIYFVYAIAEDVEEGSYWWIFSALLLTVNVVFFARFFYKTGLQKGKGQAKGFFENRVSVIFRVDREIEDIEIRTLLRKCWQKDMKNDHMTLMEIEETGNRYSLLQSDDSLGGLLVMVKQLDVDEYLDLKLKFDVE